MRKINFYNSRLSKLNRHLKIFFPYITIKKMTNIFKSEIYFLTGKTNIKSYPYGLKIEPTTLCNLNCPECFRNEKNSKTTTMNFELFKKIIDETSEYILEISLYDQGEPLTFSEIFKFINYAHKSNIATVISSNFSMKLTDIQLKSLIESGLDYLIVAADGINQETYEKYRKGGNIETFLSNLERLTKLKTKMNVKKPLIEWQMIDFEWNKSEQKAAEILSKKYNCNYFRLVTDCYSLNIDNNYLRDRRCPLLWSSFSIEVDGNLSACYINDDESLDVGSCVEKSILDIWFSKKFQQIRKYHNKKTSNEKYFCQNCQMHD